MMRAGERCTGGVAPRGNSNLGVFPKPCIAAGPSAYIYTYTDDDEKKSLASVSKPTPQKCPRPPRAPGAYSIESTARSAVG